MKNYFGDPNIHHKQEVWNHSNHKHVISFPNCLQQLNYSVEILCVHFYFLFFFENVPQNMKLLFTVKSWSSGATLEMIANSAVLPSTRSLFSFFIHIHLNNAWYNQAQSLIGNQNLEIIASNALLMIIIKFWWFLYVSVTKILATIIMPLFWHDKLFCLIVHRNNAFLFYEWKDLLKQLPWIFFALLDYF